MEKQLSKKEYILKFVNPIVTIQEDAKEDFKKMMGWNEEQFMEKVFVRLSSQENLRRNIVHYIIKQVEEDGGINAIDTIKKINDFFGYKGKSQDYNVREVTNSEKPSSTLGSGTLNQAQELFPKEAVQEMIKIAYKKGQSQQKQKFKEMIQDTLNEELECYPRYRLIELKQKLEGKE